MVVAVPLTLLQQKGHRRMDNKSYVCWYETSFMPKYENSLTWA